MKVALMWTFAIIGMIIAVAATLSWEFIVLFILVPMAIRSLKRR